MKEQRMCFRDQLKMDGLSTSLEDSPCISVCSTTYGLKDSCICGRNLKQISSWNSYDTVTKKKIVMEALTPAQLKELEPSQPGNTYEKDTTKEECNVYTHVINIVLYDLHL